MTVTINDLGKDVKITANKSVLSLICCLAWDAARENSRKGNKALTCHYEDIAEQIHDQLDDVGYYDNCKY